PRRCARARPVAAVVHVARRAAEVLEAVVVFLADVLLDRAREIHAPGLGAVIRGEHDERVLVLADRLQIIDEAPDVEIEIADHRGVDLHASRLDAPLLRRQRAPPRLEARVVDRLGVLRDETELLLAGETPRVERLVAVFVPALETRDRLRGRLQRPMRRRVREPREERPAVASILLDELDQLLRVEARRVEVVPDVDDLVAVAVAGRLRPAPIPRTEMRGPVERDERALEAARPRAGLDVVA